jgi:ubiquinone/menaquinone biosynthesis C-methylase UbiE
MSDNKTAAIARIVLRRIANKPNKVLVVGCGSGEEAAILRQEFQAEVVGIDIEDHFDPDAARLVKLRVEDATVMSFGDCTFDFIYSYHALEHIGDHRKALLEMRRVLIPGGSWCIGTPNRSGRSFAGILLTGRSEFRGSLETSVAPMQALRLKSCPPS